MRLYHNPLSSNARRVLLTASELGIKLDQVIIDFASDADRKRLEEVNICGKVPVLEDDGLHLWESCAIMQYLADKHGAAELYPTGLKERADVNRWMFFGAQHFAPAIGILTWQYLWKKLVTGEGPDPVEVAKGETYVHEHASVLDKHLATRQWLSGDKLSLADFAVAAPLMYLARANIPVEQYKNVLAWFERIQQLPAWQDTETPWPF
ncbi:MULTISPECIES: glutathione S-transferase family protein [unclassified Duganella]|uniref:glutathione S-transferase family protein n=1 Tax=unclassified Duganella TaxID=2636909 RepID=UPI0006FD812C|nr:MULTISPECIES: glutathione S-transferase family protein [unclassified Duganella]KQV47794.1 glutathione S-transferase [Duganella sp. Root336D2]KRB81921.1 glutathione S-transferase [Duganella sp. Root198D2]